jgi:hypothetical protein
VRTTDTRGVPRPVALRRTGRQAPPPRASPHIDLPRAAARGDDAPHGNGPAPPLRQSGLAPRRHPPKSNQPAARHKASPRHYAQNLLLGAPLVGGLWCPPILNLPPACLRRDVEPSERHPAANGLRANAFVVFGWELSAKEWDFALDYAALDKGPDRRPDLSHLLGPSYGFPHSRPVEHLVDPDIGS